MIRILLSCLAFAGLLALPLHGNDFVSQRVSDTALKPTIDGVIGEEEWADAAVLPQFIQVNAARNLNPDPLAVMLKFDAENLYIAMRSRMEFDPAIEALPHDSLDITNVDSLDITLCPPGAERWCRFTIERGGAATDMRYRVWDRDSPDQWNPDWQYRSRILPEAFFAASIWEAEIAIPWSALGMEAPRERVAVPAQFIRYHGNTRFSNRGNDRASCWAMTDNLWNLPVPETFGTLYFEPGKPVFRFSESGNFRNGNGWLTGELTGTDAGELMVRAWEISDFSDVLILDEQPLHGGPVAWRNRLEVEQPVTALWSWRIGDGDGEVARTLLYAVIEPPFTSEVGLLFGSNRAAWVGKIEMETPPSGAAIELELQDAAGKAVETGRIGLPDGQRWFEASLPLDALPAGEAGRAVARLIDASGQCLYTSVNEIFNLERPAWLDRHPGAVTEAFAPWEPVRVDASADGAVEVGIRDHAYVFSGAPLPDSVRLDGEEFSAEAWRFEARTARGIQQFTPAEPLKIIARDGRGVTLQYTGRSAELALTCEIRIEFDGLAWYRTAFTPLTDGVVLENLRLAAPIREQGLRYMRAASAMAALENPSYYALIGEARTDRKLPNPDMPFVMEFSGDGWQFGNSFNNFYWIGGEDRGVFFVLPSRRNLAVTDSFSSADETGETLNFALTLVDRPLAVTAPLDYEFGLILTPSKRPADLKRLRRVGQFLPGATAWNEDYTRATTVSEELFATEWGPKFMRPTTLPEIPRDYFTTAVLPCWTLTSIQCGNPLPGPEEIAEIDRQIDGIRRSNGGQPVLWYDALLTQLNAHTEPFLPEMERYPQCRLPIESYSTETCPVGAWPDYYLHGAAERLKQGVVGFYMDMTLPTACSNRFHGCGWRDEAGNVHGAIPFLAIREQFLRLQHLVKSNDPESLLIYHGNNLSPITLWVDVNVYGEEWTTAPDYSTLSPEFYQAAHMNNRQLGTVNPFYAGLIYWQYPSSRQSNATQAEVFGLSLLHNEPVYNVNGVEIPGLMMVWNALEQFGADEPGAEWIPYWRNPASDYPDGVAVSSYRRGGRELLVIFNPAYEETVYDLSRWSRISDALDEYREVEPGEITIEARGFRLYLAE